MKTCVFLLALLVTTSVSAQEYFRGATTVPIFTGPVTGAVGTCAAPTYTATGATTTGFNITVTPSGVVCVNGVAVITATGTAVTVTGTVHASSFIRSDSNILAGAGSALYWNTRSILRSPADGQITFSNLAETTGVGFDLTTDGLVLIRNRDQNAPGILRAAFQTAGATPAVSNTSANSCGTTAATIAGNDNTGVITVGLTAGTSCTVTFITAAPSRRQCNVNNTTTANLARATYLTATTSAFVGTFMAGDVLAYNCSVY